jgi:indolepyruvate ferredoxin oxidoreductase, alpha subunit
MERSFHREIESLKLGNGEVFHGEGILAVTKALLQSGVSYVGGYQGAPVSHLIDVMVQARDYLGELGVHVEPCTNEASAAAMLSASIMYPVRGAVTWKSIVGTNVASDALSNLASPGVKGGALIVVGEDYGEGASVVQERTHAFAMKSALWLMDPRPDLESLVRCVEKSFELSEASGTPVMLDLRIRACHLQGSFVARDNVAPAISMIRPLAEPAPHDYGLISHPPSTYGHERSKYGERMPAARRFIVEHGLNETIDGSCADVGLIVQGGLYNSLLRALCKLGLADAWGRSRLPILVLNVVYPLVPDELARFARGRRAVLVIEEGQPEFIEHEVGSILRRAGVTAGVCGKDVLPMAGEYTSEVLLGGLGRFVRAHAPSLGDVGELAYQDEIAELRKIAADELGGPVPPRPPSFCTGCPERPFFAALKLAQREVGKVHYSADIGCHSFATFAPFNFGNSILGYGMSLASSTGVKSFQAKRPIAVMGDGGFWHNGLLSGVASRQMNGGDGLLVILDNGYTSATGAQEHVSTPSDVIRRQAQGASSTGRAGAIEKTLKGLGVGWLRTVHTHRVGSMKKSLIEAMRAPVGGLKVIVAEGECQLERQRRLRPARAHALAEGRRVVRTRYGVDEDTCTGDHACIRLSGCPTLTVKTPNDPLRTDPVTHVTNGCLGCGLCGELAHEATLCPSFWRADIVTNPRWYERALSRVRAIVVGAALS